MISLIIRQMSELDFSRVYSIMLRSLDEYFGKEYFTLKDIFIEERRKILQVMLKGKMNMYTLILRAPLKRLTS